MECSIKSWRGNIWKYFLHSLLIVVCDGCLYQLNFPLLVVEREFVTDADEQFGESWWNKPSWLKGNLWYKKLQESNKYSATKELKKENNVIINQRVIIV